MIRLLACLLPRTGCIEGPADAVARRITNSCALRMTYARTRAESVEVLNIVPRIDLIGKASCAYWLAAP